MYYYFFFDSVVVHSLVSRVLINNAYWEIVASKRGVSVRANSVHEPTVKNRVSHTHGSVRLFFLNFSFIPSLSVHREDTPYLEHEDRRQKKKKETNNNNNNNNIDDDDDDDDNDDADDGKKIRYIFYSRERIMCHTEVIGPFSMYKTYFNGCRNRRR